MYDNFSLELHLLKLQTKDSSLVHQV